MKLIGVPAFIFSLLILVSCSKENANPYGPVNQGCLSSLQHSDWATIDFKKNYTIQHPDGYTGGISGIEGPMFTMQGKNLDVLLFSDFCTGISCEEFGDTLKNQSISSIHVIDNYYQDMNLNHRIEICADYGWAGILFYGDTTHIVGRLYWWDGGVFKLALRTYAKPGFQPELEDILRTIASK